MIWGSRRVINEAFAVRELLFVVAISGETAEEFLFTKGLIS